MKGCFDILKFECESPEEYGFSKTYFFNSVKERIVFAENEKEAVKLRNRNVLVRVSGYPMSLELVRGFEEKNALFLLDFSEITKTGRGKRASVLKRMRNFARMCLKYKVPFAVASFAENEGEMRTAEELVHIGFLIGLNRGEGQGALSRLEKILG
ncbi:hypothetical protein GF415_04530 [Candidatus Micrarchaeota archaeon]|nr:hypothetical protein [Candidatus Micrarchaeota archaeon]